jgi:hypothetical protein
VQKLETVHFISSLKISTEKEKEDVEILPNIIAVETIDENVSTEVQEVDSGSSHRHLRSSVSTSKFTEEEVRRKKMNQKRWLRRRSVGLKKSNRNVVDGEKRRRKNKMKKYSDSVMSRRIDGFGTIHNTV